MYVRRRRRKQTSLTVFVLRPKIIWKIPRMLCSAKMPLLYACVQSKTISKVFKMSKYDTLFINAHFVALVMLQICTVQTAVQFYTLFAIFRSWDSICYNKVHQTVPKKA